MCKGRFARGAALPPGALLGAVIVLAGCSTDFSVEFVPPASTELVTPEKVLIRFHNFAVSEAVDVEFYATTDPLESVPADLFQEENRVTANIGVAGTGIIQPISADAITLDCTENLTIGTTGGSFSDNESGDPRGVGTMRWAQEGPLGLCGHTVTFTFSPDGDEFVTNLEIDD